MESVFKKDGTIIGIITSSDIKNVPITDIFQTNENYTMVASQVFMIGKYYDIWMVIRKDSGYFESSDEVIGKFKKTVDISNIFYGSFDSDNEWFVNDVGYIGILTDSTIVHKSKIASTYKYTRIHCAVCFK